LFMYLPVFNIVCCTQFLITFFLIIIQNSLKGKNAEHHFFCNTECISHRLIQHIIPHIIIQYKFRVYINTRIIIIIGLHLYQLTYLNFSSLILKLHVKGLLFISTSRCIRCTQVRRRVRLIILQYI